MVITSLSRHTFCGSDQSLSPQSDRQICSQFSCSLRPCQSLQSYFKLDCFRSRLLLMETFRPRWSQQSYQRAEEKWRGDRAGWLAAAACDLHNLSKFCLLDRKLSRCGLACAVLGSPVIENNKWFASEWPASHIAVSSSCCLLWGV